MRGIHARCASCGEFEIRLGTLLGDAGNYLQAIEHFQLAMTVNPVARPKSCESKRRNTKFKSTLNSPTTTQLAV